MKRDHYNKDNFENAKEPHPKDIVVRKKTGTYVGCEFLSDDHYDTFGKYLLFYFQ
jgi:hypothetical protein